MGQNPDMAPYLLFIFDALAALCGNFLFMDADGPLVVAAMILLNIVENFLMSVKVVSLMSKSKRMASERKVRASERRVLARGVKDGRGARSEATERCDISALRSSLL